MSACSVCVEFWILEIDYMAPGASNISFLCYKYTIPKVNKNTNTVGTYTLMYINLQEDLRTKQWQQVHEDGHCMAWRGNRENMWRVYYTGEGAREGGQQNKMWWRFTMLISLIQHEY